MKISISTLSAILFRLTIMKLTVALLTAAQMLGWISYAQASESSGSTPPPPPPPLDSRTAMREAMREALREFDRFLDHHPVLEDQLRLDPQLTANRAFAEKNPALRDFLRANPNVGEALKLYPRYFLYRALLRQASAPVPFKELAAFRELFHQQPRLEQELTENPELVRDPAFLKSHPVLRHCLIQHPALARVFLPPSIPQESK
jgi:hypothetical protein